jgi:hypothetical protein
MTSKINMGKPDILISAIILIISVFLLINRLLATGPVQLILEDGKAVPVEGASYFSSFDVVFFIITAWLGGMSFLYIIKFSKEKEMPILKKDVAVNLLEGDEKLLFQKVVDVDMILQRDLILKTGFSEPKVSRLLDRLERKGLIVRQRNGMGNRILIK